MAISRSKSPFRVVSVVAAVVILGAGSFLLVSQRDGGDDFYVNPVASKAEKPQGISVGYRSAVLVGDQDNTVSMSVEDLDPAAVHAAKEYLGEGIFTTPMEVSTQSPLTGKVKMTRTYPEPLPAEASASFVYYDEKTHHWKPVNSILSSDRRVLTTEVDHLSLWSDFVTAPTQVLESITSSWEADDISVKGIGDFAVSADNTLEETNYTAAIRPTSNAAPSQLATPSTVPDQRSSESASPTPGAMPSEKRSDAASEVQKPQKQSTVTVTEFEYFRPIDYNGQMKPGFAGTHTNSTGGGAINANSCVDSPYSDKEGIMQCGSNADNFPVCYQGPATQETPSVYCSRDPKDTTMIVLPYTGEFRQFAQEPTRPWRIDLEDGKSCVAISGGARGNSPDGPVATYRCDNGTATGAGSMFVIASQAEPFDNGIDARGDVWFAQIGDMGTNDTPTTSPTPVGVKRVYYASYAQ